MPDLHAFRALHYDPKRVGDLSKVVAQPYDKIDERLQKEYYERHPHHIVRADKRMEEPGDPAGEKKYPAAAEEVRRWISEGVLVEDEQPAIFVVHQTYRVGEERRTRKGICAMVGLEEFGKGRIHPHEETHAGPKADRLNLLRATGVHFGQIFMLYSDPRNEIMELLKEVGSTRPPDLEAVDDYGEQHRAWRVINPMLIRPVVAAMKERDLIIADGHHRYETALAYRRECEAAGRESEDGESHANVLATLFNMDDEGLTCFATHRVIRNKPPVARRKILEDLGRFFEVRAYPFLGPTEERKVRAEMLEAMRGEGRMTPTFGLALPSEGHALIKVKDVAVTATQIMSPQSLEWRSLDVNILHSLVLEGVMGITPEEVAQERCIDYVRSADEAVTRVLSGKGLCAFLVNPVSMEQIRKIVQNGERFPQKSTDFYPKLLSGFLMCRLRFTTQEGL
jgi:uncharacterized protein (DUF1015 family)